MGEREFVIECRINGGEWTQHGRTFDDQTTVNRRLGRLKFIYPELEWRIVKRLRLQN
jgi:hypothetical protein